MRLRPTPTFAILLCGLLLCAAADERLTLVLGQLHTAKDPRLRAQAALLLAHFKASDALEPLCGALDDTSALVRGSAAKALGSLKAPEAAACLTRHKGDADAEVKAEVAEALAAVQPRAAPARIYVALGKIYDKSGKLSPSAVALAEKELRSGLAAAEGVLVAPKDESKAASDEIIRKKNLRGFLLNVALEATPDGSVRMDVLCLSFSERQLLGQLSVGAKGAGAEDLIQALVPALVQRAAKTLDWSSP
jgi:hypothetical protein